MSPHIAPLSALKAGVEALLHHETPPNLWSIPLPGEQGQPQGFPPKMGGPGRQGTVGTG